MAELSNTSAALAATLSVDAHTRREAERALYLLASSPAHAAELLALCAEPTTPPDVAVAAAVRLKNAARASRGPLFPAGYHHPGAVRVLAAGGGGASDSGTPLMSTDTGAPTVVALSTEARAHVREHIVPALARAPADNAAVLAALAETLRWLVLLDFPARWPVLLPQIHAFLSSGEVEKVAAGLTALHKVTKCYEFRSNDPRKLDPNDPYDAGIAHPREPLERIVEATFPTLLMLLKQLADQPALVARKCERLIVKTFWCSMQYMMPPHFAVPGVCGEWMDVLIAMLQNPVMVQPRGESGSQAGVNVGTAAVSGALPANGGAGGAAVASVGGNLPSPVVSDEELARMPAFKTKKWVASILLRMLKRYGNPKLVPVDEPHTRTVATIFASQYATKATAANLQILAWPTSGGHLSGRVAYLAIEYLQEAVETAALWGVILPHIQVLLSRIIFPYLCFSEDDADLWEADPVEYVRKQTDIAEDFKSPRVAAINLLAQLSELRWKNTILPFMTHLVETVLEPYRTSTIGSPKRASLARQKVGTMQALSACKMRLRSKEDLGATFLDVLEVHVEPDLRSEFGILRATANKLLGDVASLGWDAFTERLGQAALRGAVVALEDPELPVQATAGSALHSLMEQKAAEPLIAPFAPQLLERLLALVDRMSDGFVALLPTLDKLVDRYPDELMPLAVPLMRRLVTAFQNSVQEAHAVGDDDDGDDDLLFQAAQMLQLISSVLTTAGEWHKPTNKERLEMFNVLEEELVGVISSMFDEQNHAFGEELLDVLHTLLLQTGELRRGVSPFLMSIIPKLVGKLEQWSGEYMSSDVVGPIEAYIAFDLDGLVAMNAVPALMTVAQQLWAPEFDEGEGKDGAKIADALILGLAKSKSRSTDMANSVVASLAQQAAKKCVSTTEDEEILRVRVFGTVMLAAFYDASLVVKSLGGSDQVMQLVSLVLSDLSSFNRIHDKKSVILGLSAMLRTAGLGLDGANPGLVRGILGLFEQIDAQRAGVEQKNVQITQLAAWARRSNTGDGTAGPSADSLGAGSGADGTGGGGGRGRDEEVRVGATDDDDLSELNDDEDASIRLLDGLESGALSAMENLSAETGIPVADLEVMNATGATTTGTFIDFDNLNDEDDEGDNPTSALDDIDEVHYFVESVQIASSSPWWANVGTSEQNAIQQLAQRVPLQG